MLRTTNLKVEYKINPLGMDEPAPRFFYQLSGDSKAQSAYRIIVTAECGKTVWDSGYVASAESVQIAYKGEKLVEHTRYCWKVRVKDENGLESPWSVVEAYFETGFAETSWSAKWVSGRNGPGNLTAPERMFRDFNIPGKITKARLYITSLGLYEAYVNGEKITDDCFTPGWTDYYHRVQYQVYDVREFLREGANTLAACLAEGWFSGRIARVWMDGKPTYGNHPLLRAELHIVMENGENMKIVTDEEFRALIVEGPIRMSDIYMGETYYADRENENWRIPGGDNRKFGVPVHAENPNVEIVWQSGESVRRIMALNPVKIIKRPSGTYIVDFGQNITGRERFTLKNTVAGTTIVIKHGEMLNSDGSLYTQNLRTALATTTYTCGASDAEVYEPTFTYYGFRYLEISGWPGELIADQISAQVIHSNLEVTGTFACSSPLLNKLYSNIVWGQRGNFLDIPSDCPQRDERLGWTGDTQVFANMATFNMFSATFYTKWIDDLNSSLLNESLCFPAFAPDPIRIDKIPATGWADAGIICPWVMFNKYGDTRLLTRHFKNMCHWLDWQVANANGSFIVKNAIYGDWLNIDAKTPENFLSTAYLAGMTRLLAKIARLIGFNEEADRREIIAKEIREAFGREFFSADGEISAKTQTAALLALNFEIVPEHALKKTIEFLVNDIAVTRGLHLSTGFLGTPLLMNVLTKIGRIDLAYDLLQQTSYPGWLYPVTQGATTMWERWNSWSDKDGFGDVGMNSFNHYAYGAVGEWFFETVCGINAVSDSLGTRAFKRFKLAPQIGNSLTHAAAEYNSIYGRIRSQWKRSGAKVSWEFTVPCNTSAEIIFPTSSISHVAGLETTEGISIGKDGAIFAAPGNYRFEFTL